jgi:hypothetical protein
MISPYSFSQSLPENPKPGSCYVRCLGLGKEKTSWKEIECQYLKYRKLPLDFYSTNGRLTDKDKILLKK